MLELNPSDISVCLTSPLSSALPRKGEIAVIGHVLLHSLITFIGVLSGRFIQKRHLLIFFLALERCKFEGGAHSSVYGYLGLFLGVAETIVGSPLCYGVGILFSVFLILL